MPPAQPSENKTPAARAERTPRRAPYPAPKLEPTMACDTAFRVVARRCLGGLTAHHEATCRGDPTALHEMRVALTRLRSAILFFSPMVADIRRPQIRAQLKWLNGHLGTVRDLDVAIARFRAAGKQRTRALDRSWEEKRAEAHRRLARTLRSAKYASLIKSTSDWIEHGPWSVSKGQQAAAERASPIAAGSARKLTRWLEKLLRKSRKLQKMGTEKRHQLRLLNKRLSYSIEFLKDLSSDKGFSKQQATLKYLRKAQKSLGELNDDAKGRSLVAAMPRNGIPLPMQVLGAKGKKRLIKTAAVAYRKLAEQRPERE